jgi:hypothetical protein
MEYKEKAVNYWKSGKTGGGKLSFPTVQNRFKRLSNRQTLYTWEKQVEEGGSNRDKYLDICNFVLQRFQSAKERCAFVHDIDLRTWAVKRAMELDMPSFKASRGWLFKFKTSNRIVSRKITKFITTLAPDNSADLADEFVESVTPYIIENGPESVFNTDQSGFALEMHSGRTLASKGVRHIKAMSQSKSALTHSYTIQPTISASGELLDPIFLVLKEPSGSIGPVVSKSIFKAENVYVSASKSGKVSKEIIRTWYQDVFFPNVGPKATLLLDALTTQNDRTMINELVPPTVEFNACTIPPGTTGSI